MIIAPQSARSIAIEPQKGSKTTGENFLAQAGATSAGAPTTATAAATHRRLLEEMKQGAQSLGFSPGEFLSNIGQNFNPNGPLTPRQALAAMMLAYEEGVNRFEAGDPQVSLRNLTELSHAVNEHLTSIQNGNAKGTADLAEFAAGAAGFVRSMSVGVAAGIAGQIGGPPLATVVGGLTSAATLAAMAGSAHLHGVPLEQLDLPNALINDVGNLLTTIGSPQLLAFFNLPAAPTANTMRGIAMHMVRQGGADAALDSMFVAFTEATFKKQPIPDALRAGAVQGVFSFLTTAGIAGAIGGLDAVKSDNLGKMIAALDDNDASRLMSQFSPAQAEALRKENPIVYRALDGRTDGALNEMLNSNSQSAPAPRAGGTRELELVEVGPGQYERGQSGSMAARNAEVEGLNRRPDMGGSNQASRPAPTNAATPVGQVQPPRSSPDNPNVLTLNGDEFVISERKGKLIVTVPGGDDFTFPEGMTVDQARTYFEHVWLTGVLPDHAAPRNPMRINGDDFTILGAEGLFGVETPRGDFHRFAGQVGSLEVASERARRVWFDGGFDGFSPPRTTVDVANAELVILGGGSEPFFLKQADGVLVPLAATTEEQAAQLAAQRWLRGVVPGSPPPVSRLTLDPQEGLVATIIGGGQGPFAVGDRNGNYIGPLANADGSPVTSLGEASELAKRAFERGALASHGYSAPDPVSAAAPIQRASASSVAPASDPNLPDLKNPAAILRWTRESWSAEELPDAARSQMVRTLEQTLARGDLDDFQRVPLEQALAFVRGPQTHPDSKDVFGILQFVGDNWSDQLADLAPPAIRDEMYKTLYEASLSTDPALRDVRDKIRHAMSELHASGARAFPNPGDLTFGTGFAEDLTQLGGKLGVPDGEFLGLNTRGHPVFQTREGGRVGPFYEVAGELAAEAKPAADADPLSLMGNFWKNYDMRIGGSLQVTDQLTDDPLLRAGAGVGRDTFTTIRDAFRPLAPEAPPRPGPLETFFTALGFGARIGENLIEPRIGSRVFLDQIGLQGFGANSAIQFKVATLENQAVQSLRGQPSAFNFQLAAEDPIDLSVPGKVTVRGNLALNADPTANGVDAFGNTNGSMFVTNEPIPIDKTMRELYLPKLELFGLSTPGMEYREESAGSFLFPESVVPEAFVQIVNRRVGNSPIEVTMPGDFPNTEAGRAAALAEIRQSLAGNPSFISEIPAEEIKGEMVGGYAQRISSVPGSKYAGANNLDINFLPGEGVVNDVLRGIGHLRGREYQTMPFERSLPGINDPVNAILNDAMHGYNKKVRFKVDIPFVRADVGPVKLRTAFYLVRERQEDMRTALMASNERAMLGFASEMGPPREVAVPTWLATMVSESGKPGHLEAELGMIPFPAGGIVVPPGGVDSLRGFLMDEFQDGTDAERQAIMSFLGSHMNGANGRIRDNATLMPQDRDDLIELLHTIANPVQALPGD
jgi:hypothetical protein